MNQTFKKHIVSFWPHYTAIFIVLALFAIYINVVISTSKEQQEPTQFSVIEHSPATQKQTELVHPLARIQIPSMHEIRHPSIDISYPGSGDVLIPGEEIEILWETQEINESVTIIAIPFRNGVQYSKFRDVIAENVSLSAGSIKWVVLDPDIFVYKYNPFVIYMYNNKYPCCSDGCSQECLENRVYGYSDFFRIEE